MTKATCSFIHEYPTKRAEIPEKCGKGMRYDMFFISGHSKVKVWLAIAFTMLFSELLRQESNMTA